MVTTRGMGIGVAVFAAGLTGCDSPLSEMAAGGLLHPARHRLTVAAPEGCVESRIPGEGLMLAGWRCRAAGKSRGTVVYLHGIADNRASARGIIQRYTARGLDVLAYDSRAHGESDGDACTYGFFEKHDLRRVIDSITSGPVILFGTSLGAAVAIQEAADDPRVSTIVAAEVFSDLRTVARERAPLFLTRGTIDKAFRLAERDGHFVVDAVSPFNAAPRISVPVLLIHGVEDQDTPPAHSERVHAALGGPKRLILVPHAGHNRSLSGVVWGEIDTWIEQTVSDNSHRMM
jgi:uncharacterized protein